MVLACSNNRKPTNYRSVVTNLQEPPYQKVLICDALFNLLINSKPNYNIYNYYIIIISASSSLSCIFLSINILYIF